MSDTYLGLSRAQWKYRILDYNGHLYERRDLVGYTAKQLHDIQNKDGPIKKAPIKKARKTIKKAPIKKAPIKKAPIKKAPIKKAKKTKIVK